VRPSSQQAAPPTRRKFNASVTAKPTLGGLLNGNYTSAKKEISRRTARPALRSSSPYQNLNKSDVKINMHRSSASNPMALGETMPDKKCGSTVGAQNRFQSGRKTA